MDQNREGVEILIHVISISVYFISRYVFLKTSDLIKSRDLE